MEHAGVPLVTGRGCPAQDGVPLELTKIRFEQDHQAVSIVPSPANALAESAPSAVICPSSLSVPLSLDLAAPEASIVPGATVTVDGSPVKVMPDGSFSEHVRRSGPGEVVVRATAPDGQLAEQARAVSKR